MASQPRLALAVSGMDALLWKPEDSEKEGEREGDAASWRTSADGLLDVVCAKAAALELVQRPADRARLELVFGELIVGPPASGGLCGSSICCSWSRPTAPLRLWSTIPSARRSPTSRAIASACV